MLHTGYVLFCSATDANQIYNDWRLLSQIEHGCRLDQEQGLDIENMRVQILQCIRRLFSLVLAAAQAVFLII